MNAGSNLNASRSKSKSTNKIDLHNHNSSISPLIMRKPKGPNHTSSLSTKLQ